MKWRQAFLPRQLYKAFKRGRLLKQRLKRPLMTLLLRGGWPQPLARYLGGSRFQGHMLLHKQGIRSVVVGDRFYRYATKSRSVAKLQKEYLMWERLRAEGLADIVQRSMSLRDCADGKILETTLLQRIWPENQVEMTLPIIRALVAAARPAVQDNIPATVEAGIRLGRFISGGELPASFASEEEIRSCFARQLRSGISHQDLHVLNVMQDADGKPVLIDLKSCGVERVVSIDILMFVSKYMQIRDVRNLIESVFIAQQKGWRVAELEPVLALIDLPRSHWAQILVLHLMGVQALKRKSVEQVSPLSQKLYLRMLSRDWRSQPT